MNPAVLAKLVVTGTKTHEDLIQSVGKQNLPACYGGEIAEIKYWTGPWNDSAENHSGFNEEREDVPVYQFNINVPHDPFKQDSPRDDIKGIHEYQDDLDFIPDEEQKHFSLSEQLAKSKNSKSSEQF